MSKKKEIPKSRGRLKLGNKDGPFGKSLKGGRIDTGHDYSEYASAKSRWLIVGLLLLPYAAILVYLILQGLLVPGVFFLLLPVALLFVFRALR